MYDNADYQDFVEGESLYDILEREIIPEFYDRTLDGLPRRWIARMKASMRTCTARFSACRMVREYTERLYVPALHNGLHLRENGFAATRSLADWKRRIAERWSDVEIQSFKRVETGERTVGSCLTVRAVVKLGDIDPVEVAVQLYHGPAPSNNSIERGQVVAMNCDKPKGECTYEFTGAVPCTRSGEHGFAVRVLPKHPDISGHYIMHLLKWG